MAIACTDSVFKGIGKCLANDKDNFAKTCRNSIVDGVIQNRLTAWPYASKLLRPSEAASHSRCHHHQRWRHSDCFHSNRVHGQLLTRALSAASIHARGHP